MPPALNLVNHHHPATFRSRGVASPFTTPLLAGTRVRESRYSGTELVVPNPSGGRGVYILNWPGVRSLCQPTVHDTVLFQRFSRLDTITPTTVRDAALTVAQEGYAGQEAADASRTILAADRERRVRTHLLLLTRLMAQIDPGGEAAAPPSSKIPDFDRRASAMLYRIAPRFGMSGAQLSNTLGAMGEAYAPTGIATSDGAPAYVPCLLGRLSETAAEMQQWLEAGADNDINGLGRSVLDAMNSARRTGETLLDNTMASLADPVALLQRWTADLPASQITAMRCEWLLDGWEQLCLLWQAAPTVAIRRAALLEIAPLVPVVPREAMNWTDVIVPAASMEEACRVTSQQDAWRTGPAAFALIERNEKLRAMST